MGTSLPRAWSWSEPTGPAQLRAELEQFGATVFHLEDAQAVSTASVNRSAPALGSMTCGTNLYFATCSAVGFDFSHSLNDRVAIVLDNGPEMAACFIACAAGTADCDGDGVNDNAQLDQLYCGALWALAIPVRGGGGSGGANPSG